MARDASKPIARYFNLQKLKDSEVGCGNFELFWLILTFPGFRIEKKNETGEDGARGSKIMDLTVDVKRSFLNCCLSRGIPGSASNP